MVQLNINAVLDDLLLTFIEIHTDKYHKLYKMEVNSVIYHCSIAWRYYFGSDQLKQRIRNQSPIDSNIMNEILVSIEMFMKTAKHVTKHHSTKDLIRKLELYEINKVIVKN